jgi:hypothetical protein
MSETKPLNFPTSENRPRPPKDWSENNRTLHHIISWEVIKQVWEAVAQTCSGTSDSGAQRTMEALLTTFKRNPSPDAIEALKKLARGPIGKPHDEVLAAIACWAPWNLVQGPKAELRLDDPNKGQKAFKGKPDQLFKYKFDRFRIGLTESEEAQLRCVAALYTAFDHYLAAPHSQESLLNLTLSLRQLRPTLALCHSPIPFRESMWEQEGTKWRKALSEKD